MLVRINTLFTATLLTLPALMTVGCSEADLESRFVYSASTEALMREAQDGIGDQPGVKKIVDQHFGDPQHLNAWSKLPLNIGGTFGRIKTAPDASSAVKSLIVEFDEPLAAFSDEAHTLQFITGKAAAATATVDQWDPETNTARLSAALDADAPAEGDQLVIDGGELLQQGRGLYMRHCSHCHGTSGDGDGPTARYLWPRPRDYRHGVFKFTSTDKDSKVARDDLRRVLANGIPGTYMPSFVPMLHDEELDSVVEYIRFLSMRGEFERRLAAEFATDYSQKAVQFRVENGEKRGEIVKSLESFLKDDLPDSLEFVSNDLAEQWANADGEEALLVPGVSRVEDTLESRRIGRNLYLSKEINCLNCHGMYGRGDGPQTTDFEVDPKTNETKPEAGLHDVWGNLNQPRDLTQGVYRGGRRPIDLFRRIQAGIKGTAMPSFSTNLTHEQTWHIVNYVLSIPFEPEPGNLEVPATTEESAASL
ncbi:MAG: cytochrome c [Planctomycetaceae bacterium]